MKTILIILLLIPFAARVQTPGLEFHASINYPIASQTFPGAGLGANVLFREEKLVNFKIGLEINYFHTWDKVYYGGLNGDHHYGVLSVPAMVRFTTGEKHKGFFEMGTYVGIGFGQTETGYYSYNNPQYDTYFPGVVITPAIGLGGRFSLSERIDLLLKPEFALTMTEFDLNDRLFETYYLYARFCVGIHLKPRPKRASKSNVIKIPPLHSFNTTP